MSTKLKKGYATKGESLTAGVTVTLKHKLYAALIIFLCGFLLYVNTYPNGYAFDDSFVTAQNPVVRKGLSGIAEIIRTPYATIKDLNFDYRPLVKISFAIEYELFGENPHISHLLQALLYAGCCLFLFFVLIRIFPSYNILLPFTAALLFAAHPIHTEVVAGLKSRDELICFFFCLCTIYYLIRGWTENRKYFYLIAFLLFPFAILGKLSGMILIAWIPLLLYYVKPIKRYRSLIMISAGFLIMSLLIAGAIKLWVFSPANELSRKFHYVENPLAGTKDAFLYMGTALNCLWFYLKKLIIPHPLGWYYGYNMIAVENPWAIIPVLSLTIHTVLFVWAIYGLPKRSPYSLAILLYLTAIAPFINIISILPGIVAERVTFFASVGFCLALALLILKLTGIDIKNKSLKLNPLFSIVTVTVLLLYSVKVISRNTDWKDTETIFSRDIAYLNNSVEAHEKYGLLLQRNYRRTDNPARDAWMIEEAFRQYKRALKIMPHNAESLSRIGEIFAITYKNPDQALSYYKQALAFDPIDKARIYFDMAYCYDLKNDYKPAIEHYHTTMQLDPGYIAAWQNLSVLYSRMGMNDSAILYNRVLLERDIHSEYGNSNMGFFFKKMGEMDSARYYFNKALAINPNRKDVQQALEEMGTEKK